MQNTYQSVRLTTQSVVKPCERNAAEEPSRGRVTSQVESSPIQPNPGHCMVRVVEVMFVPKQHQCKGQIVNCTHQTASTKLHPPNYIHQTTSTKLHPQTTSTKLHPPNCIHRLQHCYTRFNQRPVQRSLTGRLLPWPSATNGACLRLFACQQQQQTMNVVAERVCHARRATNQCTRRPLCRREGHIGSLKSGLTPSCSLRVTGGDGIR